MFDFSLNRHVVYEAECATVKKALSRVFDSPKPNAASLFVPNGHFNGELVENTFICSEHRSEFGDDEKLIYIHGVFDSNQNGVGVAFFIRYNRTQWTVIAIATSASFGIFVSPLIGAAVSLLSIPCAFLLVPYLYSNILDRFQKRLREELDAAINFKPMNSPNPCDQQTRTANKRELYE